MSWENYYKLQNWYLEESSPLSAILLQKVIFQFLERGESSLLEIGFD